MVMNVIDARIEWHEKYDNTPRLHLLLDDTTPMPTNKEYRYEIKEDMFFAEKDGFVSFGFYNFKRGGNQGGCSGSEWDITLVDGTVKTVWGGWSSRSGVMNEAGFPRCTEVVYHQGTWDSCRMAGAATIEVVKDVLERFPSMDAAIVLFDNGELTYYITCKDGREKPSKPVNEEFLKMTVPA